MRALEAVASEIDCRIERTRRLRKELADVRRAAEETGDYTELADLLGVEPPNNKPAT